MTSMNRSVGEVGAAEARLHEEQPCASSTANFDVSTPAFASDVLPTFESVARDKSFLPPAEPARPAARDTLRIVEEFVPTQRAPSSASATTPANKGLQQEEVSTPNFEGSSSETKGSSPDRAGEPAAESTMDLASLLHAPPVRKNADRSPDSAPAPVPAAGAAPPAQAYEDTMDLVALLAPKEA